MMKRCNLPIVVFVLGLILYSCNSYKPDEYIKKVINSQEFVKTYSDSIFWVRCFYMPKEFLAISEMNKNPEKLRAMTSKEFANELSQFEHGDYFRISMGLKSGENLLPYNVRNNQEYSQRLFYLNNLLGNDFVLTDYKTEKIIKPLSVYFINNYGMSSTVELTLVFPKGCEGEQVILKYDDKLFGLSKTLEFEFNYSKVNQTKYNILFKK